MSERRVLIVGTGSVTARLVAALAMKEAQAQVLLVQRGDNAPTPVFARDRRKAQWKQEIHGRKKP